MSTVGRPFCRGLNVLNIFAQQYVYGMQLPISVNNERMCESKSRLKRFQMWRIIKATLKRLNYIAAFAHRIVIGNSISHKTWRTAEPKLSDAFTTCKIRIVTLVVIIGTTIGVAYL